MRQWMPLQVVGIGLICLGGTLQGANAQVLYNGAAGGTPASQGYLILGNVNTAAPTTLATEAYNPGSQTTTLDTTASNAIYAGYSNYNVTIAATPSILTPTTLVNAAFPTLDRAAGYTLSFTVQINSGVTSSLDRAGFSVLVVSGRNGADTTDRQGVEIGFLPEVVGQQSAAIFSQSTGFVRQETSASPNLAALTAALTSYDLRVQGATYTLSTGGTTLLTGNLKNYTGASGFGTDVYRTPNFLFLGDDTTSARGAFNLRAVSVTTGAAAPEPSSLALLAGLGAAITIRRRKGRANAV